MAYRIALESGILASPGPVLVDFEVNAHGEHPDRGAIVGQAGRRVCMEDVCAAYEQVSGNEDPDRSYFLEGVGPRCAGSV